MDLKEEEHMYEFLDKHNNPIKKLTARPKLRNLNTFVVPDVCSLIIQLKDKQLKFHSLNEM